MCAMVSPILRFSFTLMMWHSLSLPQNRKEKEQLAGATRACSKRGKKVVEGVVH